MSGSDESAWATMTASEKNTRFEETLEMTTGLVNSMLEITDPKFLAESIEALGKFPTLGKLVILDLVSRVHELSLAVELFLPDTTTEISDLLDAAKKATASDFSEQSKGDTL